MEVIYDFKEDSIATSPSLYRLKNLCVWLSALLIGFSFCFRPELLKFIECISLVLVSFVGIYYIYYFFRFLIEDRKLYVALTFKILGLVLFFVLILFFFDKLLVK